MGEHAAARKPSARGKEPPNALVEARRRRDRDSQAGRTSASRGAKGLRAVPAEKPAAVRKAAGLTGTGYGVLGVTLVMFLFGMVMIFSASSGLALNTHGSSYYFLLRQAIWFAVGLVALAVRLDIVTVAQMLVDDPPLARRHRVERDRALEPQRLVCGVVRLALQRLSPALAVAVGVDVRVGVAVRVAVTVGVRVGVDVGVAVGVVVAVLVDVGVGVAPHGVNWVGM